MDKILTKVRLYGSILFRPLVFFIITVTNYVLLLSTLLYKNNAPVPGDRKTYIPTKLWGRSRIDLVDLILKVEPLWGDP